MTSVMLIAVIIAMQMVLRRLLPLLCPVPCMAGWCSYEGCVAARDCAGGFAALALNAVRLRRDSLISRSDNPYDNISLPLGLGPWHCDRVSRNVSSWV